MKKILIILMFILSGCDNNTISLSDSKYKMTSMDYVTDSYLIVRRIENPEVVCYQQVNAIWCYRKQGDIK